MSNSDEAPLSRLRLRLCISLPIALGWWLPRSYGASIEAFPLMVGLLVAGMAATVGLAPVRRSVLLWLGLVGALVLLRGSSIPLYTLMILPLCLAVWIGVALGARARRDERVARAVGLGLAVGIAINLVSALLQLFQVSHHFYPWATLNDSVRIYGNLRQANHLATLLVVGLAILWGVAAQRLLKDRVAVGLLLLLCLGIALTGSRTGWVAVLALATLAVWWRRSVSPVVRAGFIAAPLLVLILSLAISSLPQVSETERLTVAGRQDLKTVSLRALHWEAAIDMIQANPLMGVGWKEFRSARFMSRPQDSAIEVVENAHNTVLHLAVELGIPAALLIVVPVGIFIRRRKPWREFLPGIQAAWMVLCVLLLHSMVEYPLWYMNFLFLAALAVGFVLERDNAKETCLHFNNSLGWGLIALTLLAMVDYDRASAPYGNTIFNWGDTAESRMAAAQQSVLFGIYADRALLPRVSITEENHVSVAQLADRLMHFTPDPQVLNARLLAYCAGGDMAIVDATVRAYRLAYPYQFDEFKESLTPPMRVRCRV